MCTCMNLQPKGGDNRPNLGNDQPMNAQANAGGLAAAVIEQIRLERVAKDMTVGELAQRADVSSRAISRYLSGERDMSLGLVERFAEALGMDLQTLLLRANERKREI